MSTRAVFYLPALALVLLAGAARADESCAEKSRGNPDAVCHLAIEEEELEGELPRWLGETFVARTVAEHGSLIRWRSDFVDLIVKDAEEL
jgi:predicted hotdog family 3-hydroxylacyl-ACP dehydratase